MTDGRKKKKKRWGIRQEGAQKHQRGRKKKKKIVSPRNRKGTNAEGGTPSKLRKKNTKKSPRKKNSPSNLEDMERRLGENRWREKENERGKRTRSFREGGVDGRHKGFLLKERSGFRCQQSKKRKRKRRVPGGGGQGESTAREGGLVMIGPKRGRASARRGGPFSLSTD